MRHGGHERRVSASASFPWPKQVVAMRRMCSLRETCRWWRTTSRPAWGVCALSVTIFALHAENGAKWAIFAVYGEFCTGWGGPACVLGEFCTGWRAKRSTGGAQVADLLAARYCRIRPGGSAPHGQPGPGLVPYPWPVRVRYTRNRLSATMTAAMRKPVTRRGRLFA